MWYIGLMDGKWLMIEGEEMKAAYIDACAEWHGPFATELKAVYAAIGRSPAGTPQSEGGRADLFKRTG